tara:strand:- start:12702 stop:13706 length:1005 start_codon:yes stop_codon:yes gene_type:complete
MASGQKLVLAIVVPCLNEGLTLPTTASELKAKVEALIDRGIIEQASRIYLVDDGSTDNTWAYISDLVDNSEFFIGIKLTRNCGHQYALYAGLLQAEGDAIISIDADLQDDINAIDAMLEKYQEGSEVVLGVRKDRQTDGKFKRRSAALHYWLSARFGMEAVPNHADFRLMSRRAVDMLGQYREKNLYLRGIVPLLGLQTSLVHYKRGPRLAGETKYGLRAMLALSAQGITSFSIAPLRFISVLGLFVFVTSTVLGLWALHAALTGNNPGLPGWASTVVPIYLLGGLQLLAIGVAGEYIGKTYMEVKNRPTYQIEKISKHAPDAESGRRNAGPSV